MKAFYLTSTGDFDEKEVIFDFACCFLSCFIGLWQQRDSVNIEKEEGGSKSGGTIKIGVLLPDSGVYASLGKHLHKGMELYFDSIDWKIGSKKSKLLKKTVKLIRK